ncbi:hypothetical protein GCM10022380_17090 [Amycolatopsis tucumanensis]|uniref:Uncharacterized protein n=1 Tax=Amycolatopsis tucumanensis TaxID=401106 RepID=A0ABP7HS75_9PSEU
MALAGPQVRPVQPGAPQPHEADAGHDEPAVGGARRAAGDVPDGAGRADALGVARGERLLIRGGTSSVGMAAASIAAALGAETAATTRRRH